MTRNYSYVQLCLLLEEVWKTVAKPNVVETSEGDDVAVEVKIGGGNPEKLPEVKFIKGKWNELTDKARYGIESNHPEYKLTFISPKMHDIGNYTIKVKLEILKDMH